MGDGGVRDDGKSSTRHRVGSQTGRDERRSYTPNEYRENGKSSQRHRRRHHHHRDDHPPRHRHHAADRDSAEPASSHRELPFDARPLSRSDLGAFRPLFAHYLDLQKQLDITELDETELRGRWKSFTGKWNRGELAEGWYDPEVFQGAARDYQDTGKASPSPSAPAINPPPSNNHNQEVESNEDEDADSDTDADAFGPPPPPPPGQEHLPHRHNHHHNPPSSKPPGPSIPTETDLSLRDEALAASRASSLTAHRQARRAHRLEEKARLDEALPRADAGTRERRLEKKKELNEKLKGFREKSPTGGGAEVAEGELMGGGDSVEEYKAMVRQREERKKERVGRREEAERARREEREERVRGYREREERPPKLKMASTDDVDTLDTDLFQDPEDYYPPTPPPTTQTYTTAAGDIITLHLVGHSPTEAHHLWNGSRVMASHFEAHPSLVAGRTVLELGAGAGLPSIVAATLGARQVVVTDFPDADLIETMWRNVRGCELIPGVKDGKEPAELGIAVEGFVWGSDANRVLQYLEDGPEEEKGFDVLVLADLLFRHSEHGNMLRTVRQTLKKSRESRAFVVFTSYRPWLQHKDLAFFDRAREEGFVVEKVLEKKMERPLFEKDPGDVEVLKTVTGWELRWPEEVLQEGGR
ncbi:protein N-terminal and lysine N-methyltransferase EFM7 [Parachaetomium inaequale]|uniref:Protein N-terminal and lysine N-methyltransferase EFM7 n=1 Tax=Parachaetomium inaequale TaxID=2588326 RepID=A0AAN6PQA9_9PEZI|nr:protein N-terminal and lysine N-methyltransferase EFM7 [Parachaetomium inaequale]